MYLVAYDDESLDSYSFNRLDITRTILSNTQKNSIFCIFKAPVNHKTGLPPCRGIGKNNIVNMLTIYLEFGNVRIFITFRS